MVKGKACVVLISGRHGAEHTIGTHVRDRDSCGLASDLRLKKIEEKWVPVLDTAKPITYYAPRFSTQAVFIFCHTGTNSNRSFFMFSL